MDGGHVWMSIRLRLWVSYLILVLLLTGLTLLAGTRLSRIKAANEVQQELHTLSLRYSEVIIQVELSISGVGQGKDHAAIARRIQLLEKEQDQILKKVGPLLSPGERRELEQARRNSVLVQRRLKRYMGMIVRSDPGEFVYGGKLLEAVDKTIQGQLNTLKPIAKIAAAAAEKINQELVIAFASILSALLLVTGIALYFSWRLPRSIGGPIQQLVIQTRQIAKGEMPAPEKISGAADEIGELSRSFASMVMALSEYRNRMTELVEKRTRDLKMSNKRLEEESERRTQIQREREKLYQDLLEQSRLAGMAEVATHMLHNIGNLLNSVDVSRGMVGHTLHESRVHHLHKLSSMIDEHQDDLGTWFATTQRGRQAAAYLKMVAEHLAQENASNMKELDWMKKNLAHIREIINRQQVYAKVSSVTQKADPALLFEDALRVTEAVSSRQKVTIEKTFEPLGEVMLEPQKVLDILVNFLLNALEAVRELPVGEGRLAVSVYRADAGRLQFAVRDNGSGIRFEDQGRLFTFGFTTKEKGHGVGLHHAALTARDMHGAVSAESDGLGKGACFILDLPFTPAPV